MNLVGKKGESINISLLAFANVNPVDSFIIPRKIMKREGKKGIISIT